MANILQREGPATFPSVEWQGFGPSFDVKETKGALVVRTDLPGMTEKDVSISVAGNRLTLCGERSYGAFHRIFALPEEVDVDGVYAELRAGVLRLTLPKKRDGEPRRIEVTGGK